MAETVHTAWRTCNNRFANNGRSRPLLLTPRPQQPLLPTPQNRRTTHPRPPANHTSRTGQPQRFRMPLTNRFTALKDLHSETATGEQTYLVGDSIVRPRQETWKGVLQGDSIVRPLQETWRGFDKNGKHKNRESLVFARCQNYCRQWPFTTCEGTRQGDQYT